MNDKDKDKILDFILALMPRDAGAIYYSTESDGNDCFYFYTGLNCEVKIRSMGSDVNFQFKGGVLGERQTKDISVSFEFEDVRPLLEQIFEGYRKSQAEQFLCHNKMTIEDVMPDINFINNYLMKTDLSKKFEKEEENINLKLTSPDGAMYSVNVGRLYNFQQKKTNMLHIAKIPTVLEGRGTNGHVYMEHMIPGWEIAKFEAFKTVMQVDNGSSNFNDFYEQLSIINPKMGVFLLSSKLNSELEDKKTTPKPLKL